MNISFTCKNCQQQHSVQASYAGKSATCKCGARITVPEANGPIETLLKPKMKRTRKVSIHQQQNFDKKKVSLIAGGVGLTFIFALCFWLFMPSNATTHEPTIEALKFVPEDANGLLTIHLKNLIEKRPDLMTSLNKFASENEKASDLVNQLIDQTDRFTIILGNLKNIELESGPPELKDGLVGCILEGSFHKESLKNALSQSGKDYTRSRVHGHLVFTTRVAQNEMKKEIVQVTQVNENAILIAEQTSFKKLLDVYAKETPGLPEQHALHHSLSKNKEHFIWSDFKLNLKKKTSNKESEFDPSVFKNFNLYATLDEKQINFHAGLRIDTEENCQKVYKKLSGLLQMAQGFAAMAASDESSIEGQFFSQLMSSLELKPEGKSITLKLSVVDQLLFQMIEEKKSVSSHTQDFGATKSDF